MDENQDSEKNKVNELLETGDKHSLDAIEYLEKALEVYQQNGDALSVANTHFELAKVYASLGQRHFWQAAIDVRPLPPPPPPPSTRPSRPRPTS